MEGLDLFFPLSLLLIFNENPRFPGDNWITVSQDLFVVETILAVYYSRICFLLILKHTLDPVKEKGAKMKEEKEKEKGEEQEVKEGQKSHENLVELITEEDLLRLLKIFCTGDCEYHECLGLKDSSSFYELMEKLLSALLKEERVSLDIREKYADTLVADMIRLLKFDFLDFSWSFSLFFSIFFSSPRFNSGKDDITANCELDAFLFPEDSREEWLLRTLLSLNFPSPIYPTVEALEVISSDETQVEKGQNYLLIQEDPADGKGSFLSVMDPLVGKTLRCSSSSFRKTRTSSFLELFRAALCVLTPTLLQITPEGTKRFSFFSPSFSSLLPAFINFMEKVGKGGRVPF